MTNWLRVDRYERPHRSGVIVILVVYTLLCLALIPLEYHGEDGVASLSCTLVPFFPYCRQPKATEQIEMKQEYLKTRLVWCPSCKIKPSKQSSCRWEVSGPTVQTVIMPVPVQYCSGEAEWGITFTSGAAWWICVNSNLVNCQEFHSPPYTEAKFVVRSKP